MSKIIHNKLKGLIEIENCGVFYKISSEDCTVKVFTDYLLDFPDFNICYISLSRIYDKNGDDKLDLIYEETIQTSISLYELMEALKFSNDEDRLIGLEIVCTLGAEE